MFSIVTFRTILDITLTQIRTVMIKGEVPKIVSFMRINYFYGTVIVKERILVNNFRQSLVKFSLFLCTFKHACFFTVPKG